MGQGRCGLNACYMDAPQVHEEKKMKKSILLVLFLTLFTELFCQPTNFVFNTKQEKISDFPEEVEVRDRLNQLRNYSNYAYPKILSSKAKLPEKYNQDVSSPIYIAYYILMNLEKEYVSQDLFSEIVQSLMTIPKESNKEYYSKIYIAENMQISNIICFLKNRDKLQIDIFENKGKKSIILNINYINDNIQISYNIAYSDYKNNLKLFPKDFIEAAWYSMWDFQWKTNKTDFVLSNEVSKLYTIISEELNKKNWSEFCNNFKSIIFMEEVFEKLYYKPDYLERMIFTELIQRCLIAGM